MTQGSHHANSAILLRRRGIVLLLLALCLFIPSRSHALGAAPAPPPQSPAPPAQGSGRKVAIQAGHWKQNELPPELAHLHNRTGTSGGGETEWRVALNVAEMAAKKLRDKSPKYTVEVLPATTPPGYTADAFVMLHCDGNDKNHTIRGVKVAHYDLTKMADADDRLVSSLLTEYMKATGMPKAPDTTITQDMTRHFSFTYIDRQTPAAIVEMGWLTTTEDQQILVHDQPKAALGIANGILAFFGDSPIGSEDDTKPPPDEPPPPSESFWESLQRRFDEWWQKWQAELAARLDEWWQKQQAELTQRFEAWLASAEQQFLAWLETQLNQFFSQLCATAMLPGAVAVALCMRRRR